jgi:glycerophosphoryl diester phosphodiesterase
MYIIGDPDGDPQNSDPQGDTARNTAGYAGSTRVFRPIAHRGGSAENPENSLRAFAHAVRLGYRDLETDVRGTRDGVAVVHHDEDLHRTTDMAGRVRDVPWSVVRKARIHGREPISRLEDLLEELPDARFTVDVKEDSSVPALVAAVKRTNTFERVIVSSFSGRRLARVRREIPVLTAASPREVLTLVRAMRRGQRIRLEADSIAIPIHVGRFRLVTPQLVSFAHLCGVQVHVWTIDDESTMNALIDLGVDGIMTDRPTALRAVLQSRDRWHELPRSIG